jgi:ferric-dicitrate binding protein FerR (iron transport regulator)
MNTATHEQLIARYLNGDLTEGESKELLRWINERVANKKLFMEIKDTWDAGLKSGEQETAEQLLLFYRNRALQKSGYRIPVWMKVAAVAAVLVIGLLTGALLLKAALVPSVGPEVFTVPLGSRSQVSLADGTKVNLNSGSRLTVDARFSSRNRIVTLNGEAFFEVKADRRHPFTVKTGKFDIAVTGTKFNVSAYPGDRQISATLTEGRISLIAGDHRSFQLKPGEKISFDQGTMDPILAKADLQSETAWVKNEFIFREIPFPDLIRRLERWYDVRLVCQGTEFNSMVYSGSFKNQETIWQVLDALKLTTPIEYRKSNFREFKLIYRPM